LWVLDDGTPALKKETKVNIQARLKKAVASTTITFEPKGVDAIDIDMHPRIVLSCNSDHMASTVIPTIDSSTEDKFVFFKVSPDARPPFGPTKEENLATIRRELPKLVAWLLAREPDETVTRSNRCGMGVYRHPEVEAASRNNIEGGISDGEIVEQVWKYMQGLGDKVDKETIGEWSASKRRRSVYIRDLRCLLEGFGMASTLGIPSEVLRNTRGVCNVLCDSAKRFTTSANGDIPPINFTRQGNRDRLHFNIESPYFYMLNDSHKPDPDDNKPF
jgi:hypothetical protein